MNKKTCITTLQKAYDSVKRRLNENNISKEKSFDIIVNELSRGIPTDSLLIELDNIKKGGNIKNLIEFLNKMGEQDSENWILKDKLIEFLFKFYSY
jgi:hypothetical protein